jgi:hypothetical protein
MFDEALTHRAKPKQLLNGDQITLVIVHREPEVKITSKTISGGRERTREFVYYADGRGETNPSPTLSLNLNDVSEKIKSKTEWKKDRLITTSMIRQAVQGAFYKVEIFDEWKLSSDGQTLTQTTSVNSDSANVGRQVSIPVVMIPFGGEIKKVYRRVPD